MKFKILKALQIFLLAWIVLLASCGQSGDKINSTDSSKTKQDNTGANIPGIEKLDFTDTIRLRAGENMRFDNELFKVRTGKKIILIFTNTGARSATSMTHNVVVLVKGTDIADFGDAVHNAKNEQYVPASVAPLVIAHTKMVGGGDSDQIAFTMAKPGVYDYICSFPGHWGTMQGKIVAE